LLDLLHPEIGRSICKAGLIANEGQRHFAGFASAVFGDNGFSDTLEWRVGVVVLIAVQEDHLVGILLNRARLAQIRQQRAAVAALFDFSGKLRQGNHRHAQRHRQALEVATDRIHSHTAVFFAWRFQQLQVIDHDQAQPTQPARFGAGCGMDGGSGVRASGHSDLEIGQRGCATRNRQRVLVLHVAGLDRLKTGMA